MEAKVREKAEKRRIAEKKKKKKILQYLQQLQNKIIAEDTERFQIVGFKHKEVLPRDNRDHQPSMKAKEKQPARYCKDIGIKIGGANLCERYVNVGQD